MTMRRLVGAVLVLLAVAACSEDRERTQVGPLIYGVGYTVGADQYDHADATRRYKRCADLAGAKEEGEDQSLPPGRTVRFQGTEAEQVALVACLKSLPNAQVNGPFSPPSE